jgi:predicted transcriptional regulator
MKNIKVPVTGRLDLESVEKLRSIAYHQKKTVSVLVEEAVVSFLEGERYKEKVVREEVEHIREANQ